MLPTSQLQHTLRKAVLYLSRTQQLDGSFPSESKSSRTHKIKLQTTVFFNAEILYQLSKIHGYPPLSQVRKRLTQFVLSQKAQNGSFNYWCRSPEKERLPNDIDDSACAFLALVECLPANQVAKLATAFVKLVKEQCSEGKVHTWLAEGTFFKDHDIVVQLNVRAALLQVGVNFPIYNSKQYTLCNWHTKSKYYIDPFFSCYLANRSETIFNTLALITEIAKPTCPWRLAISLTVLKQKPTAEHIKFFLNTQHSDGSWVGQAIILEGYSVTEKQTYASSRALGTIFTVNILQQHLFDNENDELNKLISSVNRGISLQPHSLDFFLVTAPLILIKNSTIHYQLSDYRKLVSASLSGLYGLRWLNAFVDNKHIKNSHETSAESLVQFINYYLSVTNPKAFKKFLTTSLFYQFAPPDTSSYLLKYRISYEKRVRIGYAMFETITKSSSKLFSKRFEKLLELTLTTRSISDDVRDLEIDIKNKTTTGVTALVKNYGLRGAMLLSYSRIISTTEKIQQLFFTETELAPYEYRTLQVIKQCYRNARVGYLAEKITCTLRLY